MRVWKRVALQKIPGMKRLIINCDNIMMLWIELQCGIEKLYETGKKKKIGGIWDFASWSFFESHNWDTQAAVCCAFYEHVPKMKYSRDDLPNRLTTDQFERLKHRFEYLLDDDEHEQFVQEFLEKKSGTISG